MIISRSPQVPPADSGREAHNQLSGASGSQFQQPLKCSSSIFSNTIQYKFSKFLNVLYEKGTELDCLNSVSFIHFLNYYEE